MRLFCFSRIIVAIIGRIGLIGRILNKNTENIFTSNGVKVNISLRWIMRILYISFLWIILIAISNAGMLTTGVGLRGMYYSNPDFSGTRVVKYNTVNTALSVDAGPISELKPGAFSATFRGFLLPAFSELYTFTITTTGGVLLIVDNKRLIDDWSITDGTAKTCTINLNADKLTPIIIQTSQPVGAGSLQVQWSCASLPIENIPVSRMYPPVFASAKIVYSDNADIHSSSLYLTNLTDIPRKITVEGSFKPVFSPDGKKILFQTFKNLTFSNPGIYRYTIGSQEQIKLTKAEGEKFDPAYSADGKTIVYITQIGGVYEIWTMRPDGGGRVKIVSDNYENRHPVINTDGTMIIYQSKRDGVWNLYSISITENGNVEKQLTTLESTEPTINYKGNKVEFVSSRNGRAQLYSMNIDGSEQTAVSVSPGNISQPFFTNSGSIAYLQKDDNDKTDIYVIDVNDRIPCQLTANGNITSAAMTYDTQQLPYYTQMGNTAALVWDDNGTFNTNDSTYFNGPFGVASSGGDIPGTVPITGVSALKLPGSGTNQWETGNVGYDWNNDNVVFRFWYYIPESVSPVRLAMSFTPDAATTKGVYLGTGEWKEQIVYDPKPQISSLKSTLVIGEWTQVTIRRSDCGGGGYNTIVTRVWPLFIGNGAIYIDGMRFETL